MLDLQALVLFILVVYPYINAIKTIAIFKALHQ